MGIFGWDLPPGVSDSDIDPIEGPCEVCELSVDDCICPECPECGDIGSWWCYLHHGLRRNEEQKFWREVYDRAANEAAEAEWRYLESCWDSEY